MQVWASPTAWKPRTTGLPVVVDEAAQAVQEAAHRAHATERLQRARPGRTGRDRAAAGRPRSKPSGSLSAVRRSRSSGSMARVIDRVSPSPGTPMNFTKRRSPPSFGSRTVWPPAGSRYQRGQVHEPAGADLLGDLDTVLGQPLRHRAAATHGRQDHVGLDPRAVGEGHPGDRRAGRRSGPAVTTRPSTADVGADRHPGLVQRGPPQHPLEGRPPDDEDREVLVAGLGLAEVGGRGHRVAAGGDEGLEHVGQVLAELGHDPGQEPVGLVGLGAPRAGPRRRPPRDRRRPGAGPVPGPSPRCPARPSRRAEVETADAPTDHHDVFLSHSIPVDLATPVARKPRRGHRDRRSAGPERPYARVQRSWRSSSTPMLGLPVPRLWISKARWRPSARSRSALSEALPGVRTTPVTSP